MTLDPVAKVLMDAMDQAFPRVETMTGAEARAHVAALLADPALGIDTVWAPAYEGGHQDHDVTNMLASTLDGAGAAPRARLLPRRWMGHLRPRQP